MNIVIFEDEITLYWDKQWDLPDNITYRVRANNVTVGETKKTHFSLSTLTPNTEYDITVTRLDENGAVVETLFCGKLQTKNARNRIDVTKAPYFVVGDGKTVNTQAIQRAFNDCKAGETVYFPAGDYMTGALDLHSDMELYLDKDAILHGTAVVEDYAPKRMSRFEGTEMLCYRPMLGMGTINRDGGYNCQNIVIRGGGTIRGGGKDLCWAVINSELERLKNYLAENEEYVKTCENNKTIPGRVRPRLIQMCNCENIVISNLTLEYGAAWNVHFIYSKNILTYGCTIQSKGVWNGDGWDPDSSEDCTIFNTTFCTHDDAIAIKSGKNPEGNIINRPTRNIRIFDCRGENGIAIGSELSGGIENIFVWDCNMHDSNVLAGINVKTTRKRGGFVKNLKVKNCILEKIRIFTGYKCNDDGNSSNELTVLDGFYFENVIVRGGTYHEKCDNSLWRFNPLVFWGFDEPSHYLKNTTLKNIGIRAREDGDLQQIEVKNIQNLTIENIYYIKE